MNTSTDFWCDPPSVCKKSANQVTEQRRKYVRLENRVCWEFNVCVFLRQYTGLALTNIDFFHPPDGVNVWEWGASGRRAELSEKMRRRINQAAILIFPSRTPVSENLERAHMHSAHCMLTPRLIYSRSIDNQLIGSAKPLFLLVYRQRERVNLIFYFCSATDRLETRPCNCPCANCNGCCCYLCPVIWVGIVVYFRIPRF